MRIPRGVRSVARAILEIAAVLGLAQLAGCGQKGPLYLPETKPAVIEQPATAATPAATTPAPEKPDDEEEKPR
jgi:predicted small lipoprotein YifL